MKKIEEFVMCLKSPTGCTCSKSRLYGMSLFSERRDDYSENIMGVFFKIESNRGFRLF